MKKISMAIYLLAVAAGITCALLQYILHTKYELSHEALADIWLTRCYPALLAISFIAPFIRKTSPWMWALILALSDYIFTGILIGVQVPPLEILFMLIMAIPYVIISYIANIINSKYRSH